MAKYQRFDELPAWQEASRLYQRVLDISEEANVPLSSVFRTQLERSALNVSSHIAKSFDRIPKADQIAFLVEARAAAAEVQSMTAVIAPRPKVARLLDPLQQIRTMAESCARQLVGWIGAMESGPKQSSASQPGVAGTGNAQPSLGA